MHSTSHPSSGDTPSKPPLKTKSAATTVTSQVAGVSSAGIIVLQWLTYAFWGWTILAVTLLVGLITNDALNGASAEDSTTIIYASTAAVILLAISFVCDLFYSKHEPIEKKGVTSLVAVIHAVIFALLGIASLIVAVFSLVNMFINDNATNGPIVSLVFSSFAMVLYILTFVRTIRPAVALHYRLVFRLTMAAIITAVMIWSITGPIVTANRLKDDRAVRSSLETLNSQISRMAQQDEQLPASLDAIMGEIVGTNYGTTEADRIAALIDQGRITYTANTLPVLTEPINDSQRTQTYLYYELCGVYNNSDGAPRSVYQDSIGERNQGHLSFLNATAITEGKQCYKLYETVFSSTVDATSQPQSEKQIIQRG